MNYEHPGSLFQKETFFPSNVTFVETESPSNFEVLILKGDITEQTVDAIVNAANGSLLGGGGVDNAIHAAAGEELYNECETLNGCETGNAKITKGYNLPAKYVIHAVGPIYENYSPEKAAELLASCYKKSLKIAEAYGFTSIAFPAISTGIFGYPKEQAVKVAHRVVENFRPHARSLQEIRFVLHSNEDKALYEQAFSTK